jgi:hypothetical protein
MAIGPCYELVCFILPRPEDVTLTTMSVITDWINAGGSTLSAVAAGVAVVYAVRAYLWNHRQRPRPIVIAEFRQGLAMNVRKPFRLQNVGSSPAFDVTISPMQVPGNKTPALKTKTIPFIRPGEWAGTIHSLEPDDQPVSPGMSELYSFLVLLHEHFNKPGHAFDPPDSIKFVVSFKSIEGERFSVLHRLVIDRGSVNEVRVELDQSLLS